MPDPLRPYQYGTEGIELIAHIDGDGVSTTLARADIPQHFRELVLVWEGRSMGVGGPLYLNFEAAPSTSHYAYQYDYTAGTGVANAQSFVTETGLNVGYAPASSTAANLFSSGEIFIPEYARSDCWKALVGHAAYMTQIAAGSLLDFRVAGFYSFNAPIDRVNLYHASSVALDARSRLSIWGLF